MDKVLEQNLSRFKRTREALIHADSDDVEHHLREFTRELRRNPLTLQIIGDLPELDAEAWWEHQQEAGGGYSLTSLDFPEEDAERLVVLLHLAESMADENNRGLSISGFGRTMGRHKRADAVAIARSIVFRPLAELLGDYLRREVEVANPAVRELAGVPLHRVPDDDEIRIFLSHKTVNKPLVKPYFDLLSEIGLAPWLDAKDMRAGDTLHRGIIDGFDHSCAVVFFITQDFKDERWLKHEINQAINRKIGRDDRFAIITLVFDGAEVPRPLQDYIYINVENEVSAARELVRALPVQVGPPSWRA